MMESFAARLHIEWLRSLTLADEMGFEFSGPGARERHWNAYRATKIDALSARVAELEAEIAQMSEHRLMHKAEIKRLKGWLDHIAGGDKPCTDEAQLRQWAFEASTLGRAVPE